MRQAIFIINPKAGRTVLDEFDQALAQELEKLPPTEEAIQVERLVPESPEQLRETLRERLSQNAADCVAVVGGDGTIMEVLPVMVEFPHVPMALIPQGTGNLLAVNLGVPKDFHGALDVLFHGKPRRIDVGKIGTNYFALLAGVGAVADIMENTASERKKLFGIWAYFLDGVRTVLRMKGSLFKVVADGRSFRTHGMAVVISNAASFMGPCLPLTPEAEPDDGLLDVCMIKTRSPKDYLPAVLRVLQPLGKNTFDKNINYFQTRKLRIESSPPLKVQADGNIIGTTPVDIEIVRNRLQIMVPDETANNADDTRQHAIRESSEQMLAKLLSPSLAGKS